MKNLNSFESRMMKYIVWIYKKKHLRSRGRGANLQKKFQKDGKVETEKS